jgi:hypothetical protein
MEEYGEQKKMQKKDEGRDENEGGREKLGKKYIDSIPRDLGFKR